MLTIDQTVEYALAQQGKEYRNWDPDRWWEAFSDCSSLVVKSHRHGGIYVPENVRNTVGIWYWGRDMGALVPVSRGIAVRGAIMLKGRSWGFGNNGHASISLGDGRQMAARGRRSGIGISNIVASNYDDALILPNVDYHIPVPVDPHTLEFLKMLAKWETSLSERPIRYGDKGPRVAMLVLLLRTRHFLNKSVVGDEFGKILQIGVLKFKDTIPELAHQAAPGKGKNFGPTAGRFLLHGR